MAEKNTSKHDLKRFLDAQDHDYEIALSEIMTGRKRTHWMWYIFPQLKGLGKSETAKFYAIENIEEAEAYMDHPTLSRRLIETTKELLTLKSNNATAIFGTPDDLKLRSCMTLFSSLENAHPAFQSVLDKFFNGEKDPNTIDLLKQK